ncbi:MAG: histidinol-phosphatase [Tunicatimonas sp.]
MYTNYHGHCHYCDGQEAPETYVKAAIAQGMRGYGFSSHAPLPYGLSWAMPSERLVAYRQDIAALQQRYADQLPIYCGLEIDYIPRVSGPNHQRWRELALDYTIGSVHFVDFFPDGRPWEIDGSHTVFLEGLEAIFDGDVRRAVERYYALIRQMVAEDTPDIVGHLDKIRLQREGGELFDEAAPWYRAAVQQTLEVIAERGVIVEVNTRGLYKQKTSEPYPSWWILEEMKLLDIPITLNSDAHHPYEVMAFFPEMATRLRQLGYEEEQQLLSDGWQGIPFDVAALPIPL